MRKSTKILFLFFIILLTISITFFHIGTEQTSEQHLKHCSPDAGMCTSQGHGNISIILFWFVFIPCVVIGFILLNSTSFQLVKKKISQRKN